MRFRGLIFGGAAAGVFIFFSGMANAGCPDFPDVSWWGNLTHDKAARYVEDKHDGDWSSYISKWEGQYEKLSDIHRRGSSISIRSKGVRLSGVELAAYLEMIEQRISVSRCLAEIAMKSDDVDISVASGESN
ncbi:MAG: hypothetical protein V3R66_06595 [Rhodospirillales bacterium]